jgi:hypothetical protein
MRDWLGEVYRIPKGFVPAKGYAGYSDNRRITLYDQEGTQVNVRMRQAFRERDGDPSVLFREFNEAFGGELYIGPRLCYKDGVEFSQPFHKFTIPRKESSRKRYEKDEETFHILLRS